MRMSTAAADIAPKEFRVPSGDATITVTRYAAAGAEPRPAVLVLPGSGGFEANTAAYVRLAKAAYSAQGRVGLAWRTSTPPIPRP